MIEKDPSQHLVFLLPNLNAGGAERVFIQLANKFASMGFSVEILLFQKTGALLSEVSSQIKIVDMDVSNMYFSFPSLVSYLKAVKPDVLFSTLEFASLSALLARRLSGVKTRIVVVVSVAISQHRRSRIKKILEHWLISLIYPWADKIVTVSRAATQDLIDYAKLSPEHVQTIYNPIISEDMLLQLNDTVPHHFYREGQPQVILGVGRLVEQKDFATLIHAFDYVRKHIPVHLLILGEGKERANLENIVHSLGLDHEVDLPGFVINPFAYMRKSSVFVLSSRWEGLPSVLIQALACSCPVVSTNCPTGPDEILDGGKYGHLTTIGDPEVLGQAILRSLQGDHRKPPADWLDQFRMEPVIQQYLKIIS